MFFSEKIRFFFKKNTAYFKNSFHSRLKVLRIKRQKLLIAFLVYLFKKLNLFLN